MTGEVGTKLSIQAGKVTVKQEESKGWADIKKSQRSTGVEREPVMQITWGLREHNPVGEKEV